jgi:hypothetical protein
VWYLRMWESWKDARIYVSTVALALLTLALPAGHGNTNKAFLGIHVGRLWCASWSITLAGNDRWVGFRSMQLEYAMDGKYARGGGRS